MERPDELPERTTEAEDAFVTAHAEAEDTEALVTAIQAAMAARRPRLAGRLVGLLEESVEIEAGSELARAQQAAALLLHQDLPPEHVSWSELEDAWSRVRARRMKRIKRRMRDAMSGRAGRLGRLGNRRR